MTVANAENHNGAFCAELWKKENKILSVIITIKIKRGKNSLQLLDRNSLTIVGKSINGDVNILGYP